MSDKIQIRVEYEDGHFWLNEWKLGQSIKCVEISRSEWECYQAFEKLADYWHARCRDLSNEQYAKEHPTDIAPFESAKSITDYARKHPIDEDTLDREDALEVATGPLVNPTILEAASEPVKNLTAAQITALEKLGWTFMMTGPSEWDWIKFERSRNVARGGDAIWTRDVARV